MIARDLELRRVVGLPSNCGVCWSSNGSELRWSASGRPFVFKELVWSAYSALARERRAPTLLPIALGFALSAPHGEAPEVTLRDAIAGGLGQSGRFDALLDEIVGGFARARASSQDSWTGPLVQQGLVVAALERATPVVDQAAIDARRAALGQHVSTEIVASFGKNPASLGAVEAALTTLAAGLRGLSMVSVEERDERGFAGELTAADLTDAEPDDRTRIQGVIDTLEAQGSSDVDAALCGRIARSLKAALRLPAPVGQSRDLPIGGFADLANRGQLDRLLLSELAHDNDTLMMRVALGEALYMRREAPKDTPDLERRILLDVGVQSWGVGRLMVTAAALALGATARSGGPGRGQVACFRAEGTDIVPVNLGERQEVDAHLGITTLDLHPGQAMRGKFSAGGPDVERIVITSAASLREPDFLDELRRLGDAHVVIVHRGGRVRLFSSSGAGLQQRGECEVSLAAILPEAKEVRLDFNDTLPAYAQLRPAPLRLSGGAKSAREIGLGGAAAALANDGRLLIWPVRPEGTLRKDAKGPIEAAVFPKGTLRYFARDLNSIAVAHWRDGDMELHCAHINRDGEGRVFRSLLSGWPDAVGLSGTDFIAAVGSQTFELPSCTELPKTFVPPAAIPDESVPYGVRRDYRATLCKSKGFGVGRLRSGAPALYLDGNNPYCLCVRDGKVALEFWRHEHGGLPPFARPQRLDDKAPSARFMGALVGSLGSRVWFDRRGLLHLRSSDPSQGELSIALIVEGGIAAWSSRGWYAGNAYAYGDRVERSDAAFCAWVTRFAEDALNETFS